MSRDGIYGKLRSKQELLQSLGTCLAKPSKVLFQRRQISSNRSVRYLISPWKMRKLKHSSFARGGT